MKNRMEQAFYYFVSPMQQEAHELARGLRRRDPDLLDQLIQKYHYRLFRYLFALTGNRETAEDLFQETWLRVLERGHQYSTQWKFETWLFAIARNLAVDLLRRRRPESLDAFFDPARASQPMEHAASDHGTPFEQLSEGEQAVRISQALGQLPSTYREVLVLRFQEDLGLSEIAAVVNSPLSTVKSRLYRGLDALRKVLEAAKL